MNPKTIVRDGYDQIAEKYRSDAFDYEGSMYREYLSWLEPRLKTGERILDLGCGCGIPVAKVLSRRFEVLGVDISPVQVQRAKELVPEAEFRCADFTELSLAPSCFGAIVAFYSIIHVPVADQPALFESFGKWLTPGGLILASVGWRSWTGTETDWCGVSGATMYWSHADTETYRRWLADRGFKVIQEGFLPEGRAGHSILLAEKCRDALLPN